MPIENEVLRQKREREFQTRMLASIEKPKPNRLLAIINAPIFLWLISAIFLTGGAAVFQTRQQCTQQSEAAWRKNVLAQNELRNRLIYFEQEVLDAKTAQELQTAIKKRNGAS
jgi:hypothetical protein